MNELMFYGGLILASASLIVFIIIIVFINFRNKNKPVVNRKMKIIILIIMTVIIFTNGIFYGFIGYNRINYQKSALAFAQSSSEAYVKGDVESALGYALQALPDEQSTVKPPLTYQVKRALTDALNVYKLSDTFKPYAVIKLPSEPLNLCISPDGKTTAAVYAYEIEVFDTETQALKTKLPMVESELADAVFIDNTKLAFAGRDGISVYDVENDQILWSGKPATSIAVSQTGDIAIVYKDDSEATVYDALGRTRVTLSFADKKQQIQPNFAFANPNDNLFALNKDGSLLSVSFSDGSIALFDLNNSINSYEVLLPSQYTRFDGGFYGEYFAFSACGESTSAIAVLDLKKNIQTVGIEEGRQFILTINETGIYVLSNNLLTKLDPDTGGQSEMAYLNTDIHAFACDDRYTLATAADNYSLFNSNARQLDKRFTSVLYDFVQIAGDYAVIASRNNSELYILKMENHKDSEIFAYNLAYKHSSAFINAEGSRVTLLSNYSFRTYDINGGVLNTTHIPGTEFILKFVKNSGNIAAVYKDALHIYSGEDGTLLFDITGLKSVFYADYGISVLDRDGSLNLIDLDTGQREFIANVQGDYAAFCGTTVDSRFLQGRELIGACKTESGYLFVVSDGKTGSVYNEDEEKLFDIPTDGKCKALFTAEAVVISPEQGSAAAYSLMTGKLINKLEPNTILNYITAVDEYLVSGYTAPDGRNYGILLNSAFEPLAYLPDLTDISDNKLIFDCDGALRQSHIYSFEELVELAKK